jgi:trehalose 6-phosphate synthase/phosphatase
MERTCKDHFIRRCWGIGLSFGFRVVALDRNFKKLNIDHIESAYIKSKKRAILLDYDGTVMPQTSINKTPSSEVISMINTLCSDVKNTVFVVSGRGRDSLGKWLAPCKKLGIASEHGYFVRYVLNYSCLLLFFHFCLTKNHDVSGGLQMMFGRTAGRVVILDGFK